jgi:F-type H+-transporting ATPase subunit a
MPTQLLFTRFLNHYFAGPVNSLLHALHVDSMFGSLGIPMYPRAPITNAFAMELLVFLVLVCYFIAVRLSLKVETPGPMQHLAEITNEFVVDQSEQIIGHGYERFTSYLTAIALFILLGNLMGLVPGLESPTADITVPLDSRC